MNTSLPNYKFCKRSKTPANLRNLCSTEGKTYLAEKLHTLRTAPNSGLQTPITPTRKSTEKVEKIKSSNKSKTRTQRIFRATVLVDNVEMPIEYIVMNQIRKNIFSEIEKKNPFLTSNNQEFTRYTSAKTGVINVDAFLNTKQVEKQKKELVSRSCLTNAAYQIRALPNSIKIQLSKNLKKSIPSGTRFHKLI